MEGDLCYKHGGTALCYKHGGTALIYKANVVREPITLYIDYEPKSWTCQTYGSDHNQEIRCSASAGNHSTGWQYSAATIVVTAAELAGLESFTLTIYGGDPCAAHEDPGIQATVIASQRGAASQLKRVAVATGGSTTLTISLTRGKLTGMT